MYSFLNLEMYYKKSFNFLSKILNCWGFIFSLGLCKEAVDLRCQYTEIYVILQVE